DDATRALRPSAPVHQPTRQERPLPPPQRSVAHPETAAHPTTAPARPGSAAGGKRRAVLIGGLAGGLVAVSALLIGTMNDSDSNGSVAQANTPTSSTANPGATTTTAAALGATPSSGTVDWGSAGQLIVDFYNSPSSSWSLLTPAAQAAYGSQQDFQDYWSSRIIESFANINAATGANNSDG